MNLKKVERMQILPSHLRVTLRVLPKKGLPTDRYMQIIASYGFARNHYKDGLEQKKLMNKKKELTKELPDVTR